MTSFPVASLIDTHSLTRRRFLAATSAAVSSIAVLHTPLWALPPSGKLNADVCIYGGTSGGVIAAVSLARTGRSVALVEPTRHLGGMTSGGLGWIDVKYGGHRAYGSLTGEYYRRIVQRYAAAGIDTKKYGNDGAVAEPHVAEAVLEEMLAEVKQHITVFRESRLASVQKRGRRLQSITLDRAPVDDHGAPTGTPQERNFAHITAHMFLDCSYEGDLLAAAGVAHRGDREGSAEYNESAAGIHVNQTSEFDHPLHPVDPYRKPGDPSSGLIPFVSSARLDPVGSPSPIIQAFNFRLCLVKENPIPVQPGEKYKPEQYELFARTLAAQKAAGDPFLPQQFHTSPWRLLKISPLPNGKTDVNNAGYVSMDFVEGGATAYATATWKRRGELWRAHEDYQRGMLYFLQTDPRVDESLRAEVRKWGLAPDEFKDTHGWPTQLYVREARRMVGAYVVKQSDCEHPPATMLESVGLGTYSLDSHGCQRLVHAGSVISEGGFLLRTGPYPIPYRCLTPRASDCENLLVTFCVSSTHVAFASIRMEPPFMVLSESAAVAADMAITGNHSVQAIDMSALAKRLRELGQIVLPEQVPPA